MGVWLEVEVSTTVHRQDVTAVSKTQLWAWSDDQSWSWYSYTRTWKVLDWCGTSGDEGLLFMQRHVDLAYQIL